MTAQELSAVLWRERELLDQLLFKLTEEQLLLTSGNTRWLHHATREVEKVLESMQLTHLERDLRVGGVAEEFGVPGETQLARLVEAAPVPWREIFAAHHSALNDLVGQIRQIQQANLQFTHSLSRSTQETLSSLQSGSGMYDSRGSTMTEAAERGVIQTDL